MFCASIEAKRPDGQSWDGKSGEEAGEMLGDAVGLVGDTVWPGAGLLFHLVKGIGRKSGPEDQAAPDPMVTIKLLDATGAERRVVHSPVFAKTTEPRWEYDFLYDEVLDGARWLVAVDDVDGRKLDPIGNTEIDFKALVGNPRLTFGSVKQLEFVLTNLDPPLPQRSTTNVAVAAASGRLVGTGISVLDGETLDIRGTGTVCLKTSKGPCSIEADLDGRTDRKRIGTGLPEFWRQRNVRNGALVGAILRHGTNDPLVLFLVGSHGIHGRVLKSGDLALGVNDRSGADNSGLFDVAVTVELAGPSVHASR